MGYVCPEYWLIYRKEMKVEIAILGASYGSLLSTKLLMAGHNVTLVCLQKEAGLINGAGTEVRIKLRDEDSHRSILSGELPGRLAATTPVDVKPAEFDMFGLAMQEPQYGAPEVADLLKRIAATGKPCLSIMNMPPLAYLRRIPSLDSLDLSHCYAEASVWACFDPGNVTLCSPDPQAVRPPDEGLNVLHVGLPTNFKAASFENKSHHAMLEQLSADIDNVRLDGKEVPVKLRVHQSLFVPLAKWSMLLTGNYRCIKSDGIQAIKDAVHSDVDKSREIYNYVSSLVQELGGSAADAVPFEKYAAAAQSLLKPSSAARGIDGGATRIERVDRVVQSIGKHLGKENSDIDAIVATVDARLAANKAEALEPA